MRRFIPLAAGGAVALTLAGCSADTKDFQEQGEKFVEGDEVRERFGMVRMSEAECDEPANTEKDTLYTCTATGSDDNTWQFTIEITGSKSLRIIEGVVIAQGAPSSTEPGGSSPTTGPTTGPTTSVPTTAAGGSTTAAPSTSARPTTTAAGGGGGATTAAPTTARPTTTAAG